MIPIQDIDDSELDSPIWRYLTFPKFVSLLTYEAIWFSKLNILTDQFEGAMPRKADDAMRRELASWKIFQERPNLAEQLDHINERNVRDGRELTVVNCWFTGEFESARMWNEYGGEHGVAVVSTVRRLQQHVMCRPELSFIGRVRYVDHATYEMSHYHANQAGQRALLKDKRFDHESEIRIVTMSIKGPMCVNFDGSDLTPDQYFGANMNNFDKPGLYIKTRVPALIAKVVLPPNASEWFDALIRRFIQRTVPSVPVERSMLDGPVTGAIANEK